MPEFVVNCSGRRCAVVRAIAPRGRLIVLVLSLFLTGQFRQHLWRIEKRELSILKSFAHLPIIAPMILETLCIFEK